MILNQIYYTENVGLSQEWTLENLALGPRNLMVGKNASGKSRTLNVISCLARLLFGQVRPNNVGSASYNCQFSHSDQVWNYLLNIHNAVVVSEQLYVNGNLVLDRGEGGEGQIFAEAIDGGQMVRFQAPITEIAAVVRRDEIQHSFLEPLYDWAAHVRHFQFGTPLGRDHLALFTPDGPPPDDRDGNQVVGIFRNAEREFGPDFVPRVIADMERLGYYISNICLGTPHSIRIQGPELLGLCVQERDLPGLTDQPSMSQGMFRVLSLLIQLNYFELRNAAACILVDDIGEGLDFDRSCLLIRLLREKATNSGIQLILSSNDRFIMNEVPLDEWSVIRRSGNHVRIRNYSNASSVFEEFKFTGLSNFSFLEMDILGELDSDVRH